jgi:hypothetical protein
VTIPPTPTDSRWAAVELDSSVPDLESRWAKFLDAVRRQPAEVFQARTPDPRWTPTTTGEPPYTPGVTPEVWPTPRPSPSSPVAGGHEDWWAEYMGHEGLDWDDS